jgi:hypothetical protein
MSDATQNTGYRKLTMKTPRGTKEFALSPDDTLMPIFSGGAGEGGDGGSGGEGGDGGSGSAGQGQGGDGDQGDKLELTPGQQTQVNGLIDRKYGEAMTKAEAKYSGEIANLRGEIQGLKTELESKVKDAGANKDKDNDLSALRDKINSMEAALEKSHSQTATGNIKSTAAELGAINSDQVAMLISPFVRIEDGKVTVLNAKGQPRFSGESKEEMTVGELVKEYLNDNPHLVKASNGSGAGSKGAGFKGTKEKVDLSKLPPAERITKARELGIK